MHKKFYASGFLYHPASQQILLQQNSSNSPQSLWSLFVEEYSETENPVKLFKNKISNLLDINLKIVRPVYSYLDEDTEEFQYIVYSKVPKLKKFSSKKGLTFCWFNFKDVLKLKINEQTKHDIVVGRRVIEAAGRKSRGEHTFQ